MREQRPNRGTASEAMVERALEYWQQKPRPEVMPPIKRFVHAPPNSPLDKKQIDFMVTIEGGIDVPIQVKSTQRAKLKFERWCRAKGRKIVAIAVEAGDAIGRIAWKIAKGISKFLYTLEMRAAEAAERMPKPKLRKRRYCSRYNPVCMVH